MFQHNVGVQEEAVSLDSLLIKAGHVRAKNKRDL